MRQPVEGSNQGGIYVLHQAGAHRHRAWHVHLLEDVIERHRALTVRVDERSIHERRLPTLPHKDGRLADLVALPDLLGIPRIHVGQRACVCAGRSLHGQTRIQHGLEPVSRILTDEVCGDVSARIVDGASWHRQEYAADVAIDCHQKGLVRSSVRSLMCMRNGLEVSMSTRSYRRVPLLPITRKKSSWLLEHVGRTSA